MKGILQQKWFLRIFKMNRLIYIVERLPIGDGLKWKVCEFLSQKDILPPQFGPCPVCKRIWFIDCHTIPSPTCGSGDCEDKLLEESNEYYRQRREEEEKS